MFEVIPGILEKSWEEVEKKIQLLSPFAKTIHIDLLDGKFAPNTTFLDPKPFEKYSKEIFFELHMMVEEPIFYLKPFADAGFRRFLGHIEKMSDQVEFVAEGQLLGEVGLAIDGKTAIDAIKVPLDDLDSLLVMTINAGFSGQEFMQEKLEKVRDFREKTTIPIEVDGGVNDQTILQARDGGATRYAATSFLFNSKYPQAQYQKLKEKVMAREREEEYS
ncbi:MAG: hypothetical protein HYV39_01910 [Candidatus Levybacteria bacterium]|nr:hypothetical protein [Candidatus Levybacteria bacterium]